MSDDTTLFATGTAVLAVHGGITVVFDDSTDDDMVALREEIWDAVRFENIDRVLETLMADGAPRIGTFVVASEEGDDLRIFLRGDAQVTVRSRSGQQVLQAAGVKTWSEQIITGWAGFDVVVDVSDCVEPSGHRDRIVAGMVSASSCSRSRSTTATDQFPADSPADSLVGVDGADVARAANAAVGARHVRADRHSDDDEPLPYSDMFGATRSRTVFDAAVADPDAPNADETGSSATASAAEPQAAGDVAGDVAEGNEATWSSRSFDGDRLDDRTDEHDQVTDSPGEPPAPMAGDHDGHTVSLEEARRLRGESSETPMADAPLSPDPNGSAMVQALMCDAGHPNPPYDSACRICNAPLSGTPTMIARPPLGRLRFSTGDEVILDRPLLIGRKPNAGGRRFDEIPRQLKLDVGDGLSRSHALVHLEGWQVRVEDLGSTNNTTVRLPGRQPQRLREGQPVLITDGAVVEFGGEVECIYDVFI